MAVERDEFGRYVKGSIPNPKGRPKLGMSRTEILRTKIPQMKRIINKMLKEVEADWIADNPKMTLEERFSVTQWLADCIFGKMQDVKELDATVHTPDVAQALAEALGRVYGSSDADD